MLMTRGSLSVASLSWWVCAEGGQYRRYEIAGRSVPHNWPAWARSVVQAEYPADWVDYEDANTGTYRAAYLRDERAIVPGFSRAGPGIHAWTRELPCVRASASAATQLNSPSPTVAAICPRSGGG